MLPEVVNGVQFALQNNVNLGIEIGSAAAIQVCMVQLPIIVLADLIYPLGFGAVFNDIHLWAVVFAVIIINYIFQDGKSDYFQGNFFFMSTV
ncbi:low affinity vacuolar monovalent cation/H(+) antiporter [Elysia marginata]|uniref:Low affinity vacuolar monovalent cation/H(+) antiporter n=1 Tax=Elysia marginata TaxID=1093978 RepID=A0AAV4GUE2_9GAST|nr:low affinity vacuolar monovalent cation/H(+) antiporter [Elysia marginata]